MSRSKCGHGVGWLDDDPHFWTDPPTWGICRTDLRRVVDCGDYLIFVLPKCSDLPQMVYGYLKVAEKLTHLEAYHRQELRPKRMGNKNPNGNIIVTADGSYNKFDGGAHKDRFDSIRKYYIIGDRFESKFLSERTIRKLAPGFLNQLNDIFKTHRLSVFKVIARGGRLMDQGQVHRLLDYLRD